MNKALALVNEEIGQQYPLIVGGNRVYTAEKRGSINPSRKREVVGYVSIANSEHVEEAIGHASEVFADWSQTPAEQRARLLFKAAAQLRRRKHEFNAWLIKEAGKSRAEADADTAEAIDFLEYYARQMLELEQVGISAS